MNEYSLDTSGLPGNDAALTIINSVMFFSLLASLLCLALTTFYVLLQLVARRKVSSKTKWLMSLSSATTVLIFGSYFMVGFFYGVGVGIQ